MPSSSHVLSAAALLAGFVALPCFAADGDLDPDFGSLGIAYITPDLIAAQELQPAVIIPLPDGKILIGGSLDKPTTVPFEQEYRGMLARLNADGTVDATFGNTSIPGIVEVPNLVDGARMEGIESMQRLDDGSIIAVGTSMVNTPLQGFVIKLDADGNLDPSFGSGGAVFELATYAHSVGIDSQNRIVVAGEHIAAGVYTSTVLRFDANGTPDATFGDGGVATIDWDGAGNSGYLSSLLITDNDSVTVAGAYSVYGDGNGNDFAIARLDASGTLDASFDADGWRVFHDPADSSFINSIARIARTPDGGIAFAGYYYILDTSATALILGHLGTDGSTDTAFGDAATPGYFRPAILPTAQSVNVTGLAAQDDGKLLASLAYFVIDPDKEDFYAVRATAAGQLDATFANGGVFEADLAPDGIYSEAGAIALQPDGRIVLAGRAERSDQFLVDLGAVRLLNGSGVNDTIFADGFDP